MWPFFKSSFQGINGEETCVVVIENMDAIPNNGNCETPCKKTPSTEKVFYDFVCVILFKIIKNILSYIYIYIYI